MLDRKRAGSGADRLVGDFARDVRVGHQDERVVRLDSPSDLSRRVASPQEPGVGLVAVWQADVGPLVRQRLILQWADAPPSPHVHDLIPTGRHRRGERLVVDLLEPEPGGLDVLPGPHQRDRLHLRRDARVGRF
jgi:hypothetical protein